MKFKLLLLFILVATTTALAGEVPGLDEPVADFKLTERNGTMVSKADLLGKVWVGSFVLVRCKDGKCPQVAATMARLQKQFASLPKVTLVTFTVDPDHDTPDELKRYADSFGADPKRWLFLTGSEATLDELLRSVYLRAGQTKPGEAEHSQRLIVVDRKGHMRGSYLGIRRMTGDTRVDEEMFEDDMSKLVRQVKQLTQPDLPAWMPGDFPAFNASLNALAGALIMVGYLFIRRRMVRLHIACMLLAICVSAVFLASYLFYHLIVKEGVATRFVDQAPGAPPWVAMLYYAILGSHTLLAIPTAPLALITAYLGLRNRLSSHIWLARWTLPIWLYVSVTGVIVYWMLYRLYPVG